MQTFIILALTFLAGYYGSKYFTTPVVKNGQSRPNRFPTFHIGRIQILPRFGFRAKNSVILFHHWFYLPIFIIGAVVLYDNIVHLTSFKIATGASVGSALQGLTYKDRFKFKHPQPKS
ncbi:MAG TPA: hypothetical protein VG935_05240 [Patescibacteria group bacterium]|nr:hypothetical protein [Patescibacteria group bacterium]